MLWTYWRRATINAAISKSCSKVMYTISPPSENEGSKRNLLPSKKEATATVLVFLRISRCLSLDIISYSPSNINTFFQNTFQIIKYFLNRRFQKNQTSICGHWKDNKILWTPPCPQIKVDEIDKFLERHNLLKITKK